MLATWLQSARLQPGRAGLGTAGTAKAAAAEAAAAAEEQVTDGEPPGAPPDASAPPGPAFVASARFAGARPGYVFTTRSDGVGYYREGGTDEAQPPQQQQAEALHQHAQHGFAHGFAAL